MSDRSWHAWRRSLSPPSIHSSAFLAAVLLLCCLSARQPASAQSSLDPLSGVVQVDGGQEHGCALTESGAVYCWGGNDQGQLGDGSFQDRLLPTQVVGLEGEAKSISMGGQSSCALLVGGRVLCWGGNASGTLGAGQQQVPNSPRPLQVIGLETNVLSISVSGVAHACALMTGGEVRCWGLNDDGQLGDGTRENRAAPVAVVGLRAAAVSVAAGYHHTCAALVDGSAQCWGSNGRGELGDGTNTNRVSPGNVLGLVGSTTHIEAGSEFSCALSSIGGVSCWGSNDTAELGNGGFVRSTSPVPVGGLASGVKQLSSGQSHSCAVMVSGGVRCWGSNHQGQRGDGSLPNFPNPISTMVNVSQATQVGLGAYHSCAVASSGTLSCWGFSADAQLGDGTRGLVLVPTPPSALPSDIEWLAAGDQHSCVKRANGEIYCWGANEFGQLGDGSLRASREPVRVLGLDGFRVVALTVGARHSCVLSDQGTLRCWGANFQSQLGNPDAPLQSPQPVAVLGLSAPVVEVSSGHYHTCARLQTGALQCWGLNDEGQLGDGSTDQRAQPQNVVDLAGVVSQVSAGDRHTCARLSDGRVMCWGQNVAGTIGDGSRERRLRPVFASGLSTATKIRAGIFDTCAVLRDGRIQCWGSFQLVPTDVAAITDAEDVGTGFAGMCYRSSNAKILCSGNNQRAFIGDGTTIDRFFSFEVPSGLERGVDALSVGSFHSCASANRQVYCWGDHTSGQSGVGGRDYAQPGLVRVDKAQASINAASEAGNGESASAVTDASGRYVVFESAASNLVAGDTNGARDVFRRDRSTQRVELVSVDDAERLISGDSIEPSVSAEGHLIVFVAPDVAVGSLANGSAKASVKNDKGGQYALFLRNMQTGSTRRIATAMPNGVGTDPVIAPLAGSIAYTALPANVSQGTLGQPNVFVVTLNRVGDEYVPAPTNCVSCKSGGKTSDGPSGHPVLSADGVWMAFETMASGLVATSSPCPAGVSQVMLRNMQTGATQSISTPSNASQCSPLGSSKPSIDWSGTQIVFQSVNALSDGDANGASDIYLFNSGTRQHTRLSEDPLSGHDGVGDSSRPAISGDGKIVTFQSIAKNLESSEPDNNETNDIFVRSLDSNAMRRVSRSRRGEQGDDQSDGSALSWDGADVVFSSRSKNLLLSQQTGQLTDTNQQPDVFETGNPLVSPSKSGTWWLPSESGWGLFTVDQGNVLGVGWFTYDDDGEPTWFIGSALKQANGDYLGEMFRQTGVPLAAITGPATETSQKFADIRLTFQGAGSLRFQSTVLGRAAQTKEMRRFLFGREDVVCRSSPLPSRAGSENASDVWWGGESTSGWGMFINQTSQLMVATWYTFDLDHEALFLTATASKQADGRFVGQIFRQANGTPYSSISGAPASPGADAVGEVSIIVLDGQTLDFSYSIGGTTQTKRISRFVFGNQPGTCRAEPI